MTGLPATQRQAYDLARAAEEDASARVQHAFVTDLQAEVAELRQVAATWDALTGWQLLGRGLRKMLRRA